MTIVCDGFLRWHYPSLLVVGNFFPYHLLIVNVLIVQILEYHPKMLQDYIQGSDNIGFMYPRSAFVRKTTTCS